MMIGERVNTLGSRKVKRLLLDDDYDGVMEVAREQVDSGAHVLDVCVAMTERADEREQMATLLKKLTMNVELPLVIDTTEADVLKAALEIYPGRAVVNSLSLEGGRGDKLDRTMPLVARYGAATVAMTIDEEGMAHTAERKLAIAQRIAQIADDEYGVPDEALIFDVLTFPITTGQEELRRARSRRSRHPAGEAADPGLLHDARRVEPELRRGAARPRRAQLGVSLPCGRRPGWTWRSSTRPISRPTPIFPPSRVEICEDLIFNRDEDALARFIQFYEKNAAAETESGRPDRGHDGRRSDCTGRSSTARRKASRQRHRRRCWRGARG